MFNLNNLSNLCASAEDYHNAGVTYVAKAKDVAECANVRTENDWPEEVASSPEVGDSTPFELLECDDRIAMYEQASTSLRIVVEM